MKVTYLRLENVAGIYVGSNKHDIEISFQNAKNNIVSIQGRNGIGKTVLLSSISPFSGVTSLDERSTLPYIIPKKSGYKEIHYQDGDDQYIIKHYYKPSKVKSADGDKKDTHSIKSYIMKNGEELNENGNVTSFLALVELYFGLTQEMMRLIRIGSNVNSFISLLPGKRKEYIGKLIDELDVYMSIYKKVNDDIRVNKVLLASNTRNLYDCHISDLVIEEERLSTLSRTISGYERERDKLIGNIEKVKALIADNDIDELRRKYQDAESSLTELERLRSSIQQLSLDGISVDQLIIKRSNLTDNKITLQSKINSYRISIDNTMKGIERLEISVKKITSNNDMQSLISAIESLKVSIRSTSQIVIDFKSLGSTSNEIYQMIAKLTSFNQISQMIHTFGSRPIDVYLKLKRSKQSVDKFLKEQARHNLSRLNVNDINSLFERVFQEDMVITPNCDTQYMECPYYRFSEVIDEVRSKVEEETYDDETLRYIQVISNNVDNILNEIDRMAHIKIPGLIREDLKESRILERLENHLPFFDLSGLQEYMTILREYEIYQENIAKLKEYEQQLSIYKSSGVESHLSEIKQLQESIAFYKNNIATLTEEVNGVAKQLEEVDRQIALVTKYNDSKKYQKMFESTMESTKKILGPLESAASEKRELEFSLRQKTNLISITREEFKSLETKINEYKRLTKEGAKLSEELADRTLILDSVSTKKGMPVAYIEKYLGDIRKLANDLLKVIYNDKLVLAKFNITPDTFEVPYIKNGKKIPDVKYASQSEVSLMTMALSFAIATYASEKYNILMLDEVDGALDEESKFAFMQMLYIQMKKLKAEQFFIISQSMALMTNIPMDCIVLSDIGANSKLQNVLYE